MKQLLTAFFFSCLTILTITIPIIFLVQSQTFFKSQYHELGVYQEFQNDIDLVDGSLENVINYLKPFGEELNLEIFPGKDSLHLEDVKIILNYIYIVTLLAIILLVSFLTMNRSNLFLVLTKWGTYSLRYLFVIVILSTIIIIFFDELFVVGHKLAFDNDYWLLDPRESTLIRLFPQTVFFRVFLLVIFTSIVLNSILILGIKFLKPNNDR